MAMLRLFWVYLRVGVLNELEYRANFVVQIVQSGLNLGAMLVQLGVIFSYTDNLAGWRPPELLALVGVYFVVGGLIRTLIQPSLQRFMEDIRQGTLDFTLTKPADAQFLISVRQIEIWRLTDVVLGIALLVVAAIQLEAALGPTQVLAFVVALSSGIAMVYSFWMILATCTFWFVRLENILVIFMAMYEAGRWPTAIYPTWLRLGLTFVVPVAFATSVPAEALSGRLTTETLVSALALAVALVAASRWFWTFGVRHYSGASA